jgi:hypothetical protein
LGTSSVVSRHRRKLQISCEDTVHSDRAFDKLVDQVAAGDRRDDTLSTLAARLAALDRRIDPETRADLAKISSGRTLADLANALIDAIDPDKLETSTRQKHGADASDQQREAVLATLKEDACKPFDTPQFRNALKQAKAAADVKIDTISTDEVISSGYDEAQAQSAVDRFTVFDVAFKVTVVPMGVVLGAVVVLPPGTPPPDGVWSAPPDLGEVISGPSRRSGSAPPISVR